MVKVAVTVLASTTVTLGRHAASETVTPVAPPRFVPLRVTDMLVPRAPEVGDRSRVARPTVKITALVAPPPLCRHRDVPAVALHLS
jgi:hypothetical protein